MLVIWYSLSYNTYNWSENTKMISILLIIALLFIVLFSFLVGWAISLHSKRFGLPEDLSFKRIFNIFKIGSIVIISFAILFLILILFISSH